LKTALDKMQQAAREDKIDLLYFDEAGFSCLPNVQRSWSPLGNAHTADASGSRRRANVLGVLNYATQHLHFEVCEHSVCKGDVIAFLDRTAQTCDGNKYTFVVLDNASTHHHIDQKIIDHWLIVHHFVPLYLPPYSPELNLIEILWKHAKYHWRSFISWTRESLIAEVTNLLDGFGVKFHIDYA
jgi:hypothetical protein